MNEGEQTELEGGVGGQELEGGQRLEEFVIKRVLGSGGFGITYLAEDTILGREVVIKENLPLQFAWRETTTGTVRPRDTTGGDVEDFKWSLRNFLQEAETLASLDHPGIARVLRMFEANGTAYFVMPFVEGVTLDSLIATRKSKGKPFSDDEVRGFLLYMLDALSYLHDRGIYHRDIKPGNVLITQEGAPILIDFGSARQRLSERSMTVVESAGYTPFEQLQSRGNVGPWSDLYALGATLVKAITFETPPKAADRMMGDPWKGLASNPEWMSLYSAGTLASIDRSIEVDPRRRWQTGGEWRDVVKAGAMPPISATPTIPDRKSNRRGQPGVVSSAAFSQDGTGDPELTRGEKSSRSRSQNCKRWSLRPLQASVISACVMLFGSLVRPDTPLERMKITDRGFASALGETLGGTVVAGLFALVVALVIAGIMVAFKKHFAESLSRGYSIGIVVLSSIAFLGSALSPSASSPSGSLSQRSETESLHRSVSGLEEDIQTLITESVDSDGMPRKTDLRFENESPATNDVERMRQLLQSFFNDMIEFQNDYISDLETDGIDTLLDAERVAGDRGFLQSRARIRKIKGTVQRHRTRAMAILVDLPERLNDYEFDESSSDSMISGYRKGMDEALPLFREVWDLEASSVDYLGDTIDHLEATRAYWQPEDGMFIFERDGDLERFNEIMAKINACVERQTEIRERSLKSATDKIGNLKSRIPK